MTRSSLEENLRPQSAFPASSRASADTRHNDQATAASSTGIDTLGYDEALIVLDLNTITSPGTLDITVMDSTVQTGAAGASTITSAAFTQKLLVDAPGIFVGRVKTKLYKRYLHIRAVAATASAKEYGIQVLLGKNEIKPVTQVTAAEFTV